MTRSRHTESKNTTDTPTRSGPDTDTSRLRGLITTAGRLLGDALVLGLWTLFVTLLVLAGGWPGWSYYSLLLGGVVVYVAVTVPWTGTRGKPSN